MAIIKTFLVFFLLCVAIGAVASNDKSEGLSSLFRRGLAIIIVLVALAIVGLCMLDDPDLQERLIEWVLSLI
ncbi:MAG TPA: hypothetical protein PKC76_14725 [Saprospiraceae bacterium]|nr:hypothetical protein [Saprospiraceae bacterium]HMP25386.1 hypothetical protein [Saprospiraceae bacterium]